jgi:hydroxymethylpyrimidine/phosphomethylpyrimidine kinase
VLTVAGSDSGAGAGIQADLKTISANGAYGLSVLTSITAQNTRAVTAAQALSPALIEAQFVAVFDDFAPAAVKSGMLADIERVAVVAACLRRFVPAHVPYVLDPVMISKSGFALLEADAVETVRRELLPLAAVVTPNVHEAQLLAGMEIRSVDDAIEAGRRILDLGPRAALVKGGHLAEAPGTDVLVTDDGVEVLVGTFFDTPNTHGTGCTYSAAIATQLAHGRPLVEATRVAKAYVGEAIRHGLALGSGAGPTDHFFYLRDTHSAAEAAAWRERLGFAVKAEAAR